MLRISNHSLQHYEGAENLPALSTVHPPRMARMLARWLIGIGLILFIGMFLPWQQNVKGSGSLTALSPGDRPQTIQTAIAGRIEAWHVQEGQAVKAGDTIVRLSEIKDEYFDPQLLPRLQEQLEAKEAGLAATRQKVQAIDQNIAALQAGLQLKLEQSRNKLQQARFKLTSDSSDYQAQKIDFEVAKRQLAGGENMYQEGLISLVEMEKRRLKLQEANAKLISAQNKVSIARNELQNARLEVNSVAAEYNKEIAKAQSDKSSALSYLADAEGELSKLKNKYASVEVRKEQLALVAPQDGYVVKALKAGIGETIKEGEAVATIQPSDPQMAVELYVRAMDVPLLSKGRPVRLEFDGWPSLLFSGWPNISVGTFGGRLAVIDYVNSPDGKYRVLVTPDPDDEPWPEQLRLGSGASGWIMLDDVPIWYEIWRQLNGFPPTLETGGNTQAGEKTK